MVAKCDGTLFMGHQIVLHIRRVHRDGHSSRVRGRRGSAFRGSMILPVLWDSGEWSLRAGFQIIRIVDYQMSVDSDTVIIAQ